MDSARLTVLALALGVCALGNFQEDYATQNSANIMNPLGGWNVMSAFYTNKWKIANLLYDGLSLEWDYYSIHDTAGKFTGIIGYLAIDPRGKLGGDSLIRVVPSGANLAINGEWADGTRNANYMTFGLDTMEASATQRSWYGSMNSGAYWGRETPIKAANTLDNRNTMHLEGVTYDYTWNLHVKQAWPERDSLPLRAKKYEVGDDINSLHLGIEHWTVNMIWPTTEVNGTMVNRKTGEVLHIVGHGYRENSFGRWAFCFGGWDFLFFSDMAQKIQFGFQTYHFDTEDLDFLDVDFIEPRNNSVVGIRFYGKNGELGWRHTEWEWNSAAQQVVPLNSHVIAKKDDYKVEVWANTGDHYYPMLNNITITTKIFLIDCLFPKYNGTISRISTGEVLYTFTDVQGGGEFALPRTIMDDAFGQATEPLIAKYFDDLFSEDFPE